MQIERYLEFFPRECLFIVRAEHLRDDREQTMRRVCSFLGVDPTQRGAGLDAEFHRTSDKRVPIPFVRDVVAHPAYARVSRFVPPFAKRFARRHMMKGHEDSEAVVTDQLREELAGRLGDDVVSLRAHLGDDFDGWGIA